MYSTAIRRSHPGRMRLLPLFALLVTFSCGALVYHHFFHRSGEEATELIPQDATMIATLDLNPSPSQIPLFARIAKAMVDENIANPLEKAASNSINGSAFFKEIQPQLQTSYAAAFWLKSPGKTSLTSWDDANYVFMATVKEPSQVGVICAKHGEQAEQDGLTYYKIRNEKFCVSVIRGYMIVADTPASLMRIQSVAQGKTPSVSSLASFQEARGRLPADANLMMFGHTNEMAKAVQSVSVTQKNTWQTRIGEWSVVSITLRDRGIEMLSRQPYANTNPGAKVVSQITPIDPNLYKRLPGNAYGLLVFSQPGRYYQLADTLLDPGSDERKSFEEGIKGFESGTGMSIAHDLMSGLLGNVALGIYPTSDKNGIPDGLIVLDDANGADPNAMVEKIKTAIVKASQDHHSTPPRFKSREQDGATIWTLDAETQQSIQQAAGLPDEKTANSANVDVNINGNGVSVHGGNTNVNVNSGGVDVQGGNVGVHVGADGVHIGPSTQATADAQKKREEKQLIFATVGKTVLIASSEAMLDRAIAAYTKNTDSLENDPGYTSMLKQIPQGTQNLLLVDMPGVMERMLPLIQSISSNPNSTKDEDIVGYFGARGNGLIAASGYDGNVMSFSVFFPLDYTRVIHSIGAANKASNQNNGASPTPAGSKGNQDAD